MRKVFLDTTNKKITGGAEKNHFIKGQSSVLSKHDLGLLENDYLREISA